MRIGIITLGLNTNYGGLLQAYALQTVLQRMGHEVNVIIQFKYPMLDPFIAPFKWTKRFIQKYVIGDKGCEIFLEQNKRDEYPIVSQFTQKFIDNYINNPIDLDYPLLKRDRLDVIIVGSDQVWRPKYFGEKIISEAYLSFARDWKIKRIAYAASFGTDKWEYSIFQTAKCKSLISKFDAVSVREDSAIKLCNQHYGVVAQHALDPTMLLVKEDYTSLVERSNTPQCAGDLLVYFLDETLDKKCMVDAIAKDKGLTPFDAKATKDRKSLLSERIQPPVEQWIKGFVDADFVVTDSFHACIFSIIFNKPFIAYGNAVRGSSRIESLLKLFSLEDHLINSFEELNNKEYNNIDWKAVNIRLQELKRSSLEFLIDALG